MDGTKVWTGIPATASICFSSLMEMANPIPEIGWPVSVLSTLKVITPMTRPSPLSKGPPLLPGFREASVWRYSSRLADMIPRLTVGSNPNSSPKG